VAEVVEIVVDGILTEKYKLIDGILYSRPNKVHPYSE
jgi:hypothetical protein